MHSIFRYIEAIAPTTLPVLITGETGTGKELIARAVHNASGRKGDFVAVNVGGLDDTLFSDTLFGHEKGAFTGADTRRAGLIGKASGGTLFLDEIGELRPETQVKLLRLIEDHSYYPVGSDMLAVSDARIVVATNAVIDPNAAQSKLRKDLYFRLKSHHVHIPPLRKRKEDIPLLLEYFIEKAASELGKNIPTTPPELAILLNTYEFPGNVREVKGMVYDAISRHSAGILSMNSFKEHIFKNSSAQSSEEPDTSSQQQVCRKVLFSEALPTLKETEQQLVDEALKRSQGNQSIAAQMLGITRSALNKRLNRSND